MSDLLMASLHTAPPGAQPEPPMEGDWDRSVLLMVVDKRVNVSITAVNGTIPNTTRSVSLTLSPLVDMVAAVGAVNAGAPLEVQNVSGKLTVTLQLVAGDAAMLLLTSAEPPPKMAASNPLVTLARSQLPWSFPKSQANLAPIDVGMGAASCCTPVVGCLDVLKTPAEAALVAAVHPNVVLAAWSAANDSDFVSTMAASGARVLAVVPGVDQSSTPRVVPDPAEIATAAGRYWCKVSAGAAVALNVAASLSDEGKRHLGVLAVVRCFSRFAHISSRFPHVLIAFCSGIEARAPARDQRRLSVDRRRCQNPR